MSELGISPVYRHDTGFFKCVGSNYYGQDENSVELIVQGAAHKLFLYNFIYLKIISSYFTEVPESPKDIRILNQQSRSLEITWNHPYDGNSIILNYIVQYKLVACKLYILLNNT